MTEAPLHFVKEVQNTLIEAKVIPLYGNAPDFPWEAVSSKVISLLHMPELKICPRKTQFLAAHEVTSGLGVGYIAIALELTPLMGQVFWLMGKDDVAKITALALNPSNGNKGFSSPKFQEGFYHFFATQIVQAIETLHPFGDLSIKIGKMGSLPQEEALCIDVEIHQPKHTFWGRLVCPASFHQEFKTHFSNQKPAPFSSTAAKNIPVSLHLEVGRTSLTLTQWKQVAVGDFVLLDRCTFDPDAHKGTVTLVLNQKPLLRARIKDHSLKIVDYAFYSEEQNQMNLDPPPEDETPEEETPPPEIQEDIPNDESHLWNAEDGQNHAIEEMISTEEIPMQLTVEVARLSINLDKLLQLSPGNVLELPVKPEQGVDLSVGGKKVAKAELVRLGDMLGVKILQLGE